MVAINQSSVRCLGIGMPRNPPVGSDPPWAQAVGIDFHEVCIETSAHRLTLLFSDLQVSEVRSGMRLVVE